MSEKLLFAVKEYCKDNGFVQTVDLLENESEIENVEKLGELFSKFFDAETKNSEPSPKDAPTKGLSFSFSSNSNKKDLRKRLMNMEVKETNVKKV